MKIEKMLDNDDKGHIEVGLTREYAVLLKFKLGDQDLDFELEMQPEAARTLADDLQIAASAAEDLRQA